MWTSKLLQPANDDTFRSLYAEGTRFWLCRQYNNAVAKPERDVHSNQRTPYISSEGCSQGNSRQNIFFLEKVKFVGHVISPERIQLIAKQVKDMENLGSPGSKGDVMKNLGCLGLYSCYIRNLHTDTQPFYDLIRDSIPFHWTHEHQKLFQSIKDRISEDTILTVLSTDHPFHITVDSLNVGSSCNLIQPFPEGKRIISFNCWIFDKAEHKMSAVHREFGGTVSPLQTYEH